MSLGSSSNQDGTSDDDGKPSEKDVPSSPKRNNSVAPITLLSSPCGTKRKASSSASDSSGLSSPPRSPSTSIPILIGLPANEGTKVKSSNTPSPKSSMAQAIPFHTTSSSQTASSPTSPPGDSSLSQSSSLYTPQYTHKAEALNVFSLTDSSINAITDIELLDIYMYKLLSRLNDENGGWWHNRELTAKEKVILQKLADRKRNLYMGDIFEGLLWCDRRGWV